MTYNLPTQAFKLILQYCDDRIERKQRYNHRYLVKMLSRLYKVYKILEMDKRSRYHQSPITVKKIVIYYNLRDKFEQKKG